jgi:hypothetical protein
MTNHAVTREPSGGALDRATYEAVALGAKLDASEGTARPKRKRETRTDLGLARGESRRALIHCNYCHTVLTLTLTLTLTLFPPAQARGAANAYEAGNVGLPLVMCAVP